MTVKETNKTPKNYWSLEDEAVNVLNKKWNAKGDGLVNKNRQGGITSSKLGGKIIVNLEFYNHHWMDRN